eukprot:806879-Pelagomonas_calceolata.AAC.1
MLGVRTSTPSWNVLHECGISVSVESNLFNSTGSEPVHAYIIHWLTYIIILSPIATALYFT